jgi:hypothetical protein
MTEPDKKAASLFGDMTEADRIAALDIFGRMVIEARDRAILQWDHILDKDSQYPPWVRFMRKFPNLDKGSREIVKEALPHIVDTFMYCLLDELEATSPKVRVSVSLNNETIADIHRISWGLPSEPTGDDGWLARFSKQRYEQPC